MQKLGLSKPPAITRAVDNVDLIVNPGEVVGLVGESGCGKAPLGRIAAGLLTPSGGEVRINGVRPSDMNSAAAHAARLTVQMIFQDPYASLNPRLRVDEIVGEAARIHGLVDNAGFDDYRRPTPAHRHRARPGAGPRPDRLRRTGIGAGRLRPGAGHQLADGPAARPGPDLRVHFPRP
ncbi:hypothetical protein G6F31_017316 [Rhizopus arrhizus]|nr:hypothetical protein G6F31_017316 [Rhizopus arrhizus]